MKNFTILGCILISLASAFPADKPDEFPPKPPIKYLSPEETLKNFTLPEGYRMELVLDEASIKEPVVCAFDGNGRMYICEFRSYMQDIDGTNELTRVGLVSRHESTKGDGKFDKHTIYADKLLLPRMVLPLDDRVLINETNTNDINIYKDTKGDGVADKKELWFAGGNRGGNLEHQQSGLIWCQDNWIYQAVNSFRLRWTGTGKEPLRENTPGNGGQWGANQDDFGKMWFANAGGEKSFVNFQTPIIYGAIEFGNQWPKDFLEVWPLVGLGDVQGGTGRRRESNLTLNHFTASCGNEIVRGDRYPDDFRGDALICEPVGRLIRRAKVENHEGMTFLRNPYDHSEFLLSTDPNFRPINICNGPDGCLYIVDMYRGIIQEGAWVNKGSYLRKVVQQHSLDKNFGRGRIWRLVHKDFQPGPQPHMLDETPVQWVAHLEHPNGWWRDTAQKLLVLKGDKAVVPALVEMSKTNKNPLARIHALWTLEGLDSLDKGLLADRLKDTHPQVRIAAIKASEKLLASTPELLEQVKSLNADPDPNVVIQVLLTAKYLKWPDFNKMANLQLMSPKFEGVRAITTNLLHTEPSFDTNRFDKAAMARLEHGEQIYRELCFACHGIDGKGMSKDVAPAGVTITKTSAGVTITKTSTGTTIAPPLSGSFTVRDRDSMLRVLMKGMAGPVNGKTYDAHMIPMETNGDEWIADVASFVRNSFGNHGAMVTWMDCAHIREETSKRTEPWTYEEIRKFQPKTILDEKEWKLTASHNQGKVNLAIDGDPDTRWDTGKEQAPGMWFQIELPEPTVLAKIILSYAKSANDQPRKYKLESSDDGKKWNKVLDGQGTPSYTEIEFKPLKTKFLRMTLNQSQPGTFWSIHDLQLCPPAEAKTETPRKKLLGLSVDLANRGAPIATEEKVLAEIGERSGLYSIDFIHPPGGSKPKTDDPKWAENLKKTLAQKFTPAELNKYDGIIFVNTSGELPLPDASAFVDWIKNGKVFIGVHGAADTLHTAPPYIDMLGGEAEGHAWKEPVTLRIEDRKHPVSAVFPTRFEFADEILQLKNWKRDAVHTVISLDASNDNRPKKDDKTFFDRGTRADKDYAVAWTRDFGTGRVFYTSLGQSEETWKNEKFQQHLFGGIKWALTAEK